MVLPAGVAGRDKKTETNVLSEIALSDKAMLEIEWNGTSEPVVSIVKQ